MDSYDLRQKRAVFLGAMRTKAGYSRREFAGRVGVSEKTIQNWESAVSVPDMEQLEAIAKAADCDSSVFLEIYRNPENSGDDWQRKLLHKWLDANGDERTVQILSFLHLTKTGSDKLAQLELFCAYNQLPLYDRQNIARTISHCYQIAEDRGELAAPGDCLPEMGYLLDAIQSGTDAVKEGKETYK